MNAIKTRKVRLSERKISFIGQPYKDTFAGLKAVYTTWEGDRLVGVIEWSPWSPTNRETYYPIIRFSNGTWARLDLTLELVVE